MEYFKKTALVTGVSRGLGKEMVFMLNKLGYKVYGLSRSSYDSLSDELKNNLQKYYCIDLSKDNNFLPTYKDLPQLDLLIINAFERKFKNFNQFENEEVQKFIQASFTNQLLLVNHFLNLMISSDRGRIIIISSKAAFKGYSKGSLYCSIKAAWLSFYESVSREIKGTNVSIITVMPDSFSNIEGKRNAFSQKVFNSIFNILKLDDKSGESKSIRIFTLKSRVKVFLNNILKAFNI